MYGLNAYEDRVLATMPQRIRAATAYALRDPDSRSEVVEILRSNDPVGGMARELDLAVKESFVEAGYPVAGMDGLDAGMGKSLRKRLKKAVKKVVTTVKKIHTKITPKPLRKIDEKIRKKVSNVHKKAVKVTKKVFVKYGSTILAIAGAVLAPFTGGASLAAAAVLSAGLEMYKKKEAARQAVRLEKQNAKALEAEAAQAEASLNTQADAVYNQYPQAFQALGISWNKWSSLSVDAKVAIINALSEGRLPPGYSYVSEQEAAAAGVVAPQAQGGSTQSYAGSAPAPTYSSGGAPQVTYTKEQPSGPSQGQFRVFVEGQEVGSANTAAEASALAMGNSSPGDRVEIYSNGKSAGLGLRTAAGVMAVPAEQARQVNNMSHEETVALAERAAASASGSQEHGEKKGGFSPWWLLAIPAVFVAAKAG